MKEAKYQAKEIECKNLSNQVARLKIKINSCIDERDRWMLFSESLYAQIPDDIPWPDYPKQEKEDDTN